jgi:FAD/FMN-containing dehydrogenase
MNALAPRSRDELVQMLRARPGRVRVVGAGTRQQRLADAGGAVQLQLDGLATIARLDAPDQTCSVDCGLRREELDEALAAKQLELPCPGGGTLGGLFASDPIGASTPGGRGPRSLLLGIEAVLADGTPFRAGSRVVKSVAGFDVHKLFVGSRGRLFVGARLHLRLVPRPRAEQWFAITGLERAPAQALVHALRTLAVPPAALQLARDAADRCEVRGRVAGRATFVAAAMREHRLVASAPCWRDHLEPRAGGEVLAGIVQPGALAALLAALPADAPFLWHGGGRFEAAVASPAAADALLRALPAVPAHACVVRGEPARRGVGTPIDPGQQRIVDGLHRALDPHGILV